MVLVRALGMHKRALKRLTKMGEYERGVLDGFELALYLHRRHLAEIPNERGAASKALGRFRREANLTLDALKVHRLSKLALFFGFDDVWTPERAARLYKLVEDAGEPEERVEEFVALKGREEAPRAQAERV